jgi:hypothetical protein
MVYKVNVSVCSEIRKKHVNALHHVEFLNVEPGGT